MAIFYWSNGVLTSFASKSAVATVIKADAAAIAKQKAHKCQHCLRQTQQLCADCGWLVCPQHSWTEVVREANGSRMRELCWACRDKHLASML